jgi:hypothetical protein
MISSCCKRARLINPLLLLLLLLLQGGWDAAGVYEPGWNAYAAFFDRVAKKLTGCGSSSRSSSGDKMIIGPGWDNVSDRNACCCVSGVH